MKTLKEILHELKEIKKVLQTIASSLEQEKNNSYWELENGTDGLNIKAHPQSSVVGQDFTRMRTSPDEPLSKKVIPHFTELLIDKEN